MTGATGYERKNMQSLIDEYDRMYSENPVRWDLTDLDAQRFEILRPYCEDGNSLLDVGCGSGHTIEYFADRLPDLDYYGIDLSGVAINHARTVNPQAALVQTSIQDCVFRNIDIVLLGGVAEHFQNLSEGFSAVKKVLARNGIVYMEVPNCIAYPEAHGEGFYKTRADGQTEWHMTRPAWEEVLVGNGFEVIQSVKGQKLYNEFIWILKLKE